MRFLRIVPAAAFAVAGASVHAGLFDDDEARKQIKQLAEKVEAQGKESDARFLKLEESIRNLGIIQLLNQIEQLNAEIARLRGQVEVLANQNEQLQKRQKDFYLDLDARLRTLEGGNPPPAIQPAGSADTPAPAPAAKPPPPAIATTPLSEAQQAEKENRAYDAGSTAFRRGDFKAAIRAFQTFLSDFPQSVLAPNALYWIGICQFNLKDYSASRASQETLIKRYPGADKMPDAMLAVASIQIETGDHGSARNTLEDIIARYPASDAAAKARTRLAAARR